MSGELKFLAFCVEIYKNAKKISGRETFVIFQKYDVLNYIKECYGALHTTSSQYIVDNIDEFLLKLMPNSVQIKPMKEIYRKME